MAKKPKAVPGFCPECGRIDTAARKPFLGIDYVKSGMCGVFSPSGYYRCMLPEGHRGHGGKKTDHRVMAGAPGAGPQEPNFIYWPVAGTPMWRDHDR